MTLPHLCPRCGTDTVTPHTPRHEGVPCIAAFWASLAVGAVLIGYGATTLALVVAVVVNIWGVAATAAQVMQCWYRCNICATAWYVYPWQRPRRT